MLPSSQPPTELLRFRSAPCSLLDSLLQEPEPESLEQCLENLVNDSPSRKYGSGEREFRVFRNDTGPSRSSFDPGNHGRELGLHRLSSYPAELFAELDFTGNASGSSFSGLGISGDLGSGQSNLHFVQSNANKRARDSEEQQNSGHLKEEGEQGFQLSKGDSLDSKEMERLLEDSVPCGVRRTRISDRIRKLQELVPNMDKQTNTADMLEEAVEYVKFLQKQVKEKASLTGLSLGRNYQSIDFNANAPVQLIQILEPCSSENYKTVSISNKKEVFLSLYRTWLDPEARQKSETSRLMYSPIIPVKCIFLFAEG